jgi:hypothetical protein
MASACASAPRSLRSTGASLTRLDCTDGDEGLHYAFIGEDVLITMENTDRNVRGKEISGYFQGNKCVGDTSPYRVDLR